MLTVNSGLDLDGNILCMLPLSFTVVSGWDLVVLENEKDFNLCCCMSDHENASLTRTEWLRLDLEGYLILPTPPSKSRKELKGRSKK